MAAAVLKRSWMAPPRGTRRLGKLLLHFLLCSAGSSFACHQKEVN